MRRVIYAGLAFSAALFLTACENASRGPLPTEPRAVRTQSAEPSSITPGTCTTKSALSALISTVFGAGSPNARSALSKLDALDKLVKKGSYAQAHEKAFDLVAFILKKNKQGGLPGTPEQLAEMMSLIFCYSGLSFEVEDPDGAHLVYPADLPQVLTAGDNQGGVQLPAAPVSEPTLITIDKIDPSEFPLAGAGPLDTPLDQYPGYYKFRKHSETDAPFTHPVVVGVCAAPGIPAEVRDRLRLGHDASAGFEITPPANVDFLNCSTSTSSTGFGALARRVASVFLPADLHAATLIGGGVGGLASEFSDFGPVDPVLSAKGGVGGLASEFIRMDGSLVSGCEEGVEAPIGSPVPMLCRPAVTVTTHLGTLLTGVPVTFAVELGGGTVAPDISGSCGSFGGVAVASTDASATARACWTLGGTPGLNKVRATASVGGDAPAGVTFVPAAFVFSATANPPVALRFDVQPAEGTRVTADTPIPVVVSIIDRNGTVVVGWSGPVVVSLNRMTFADGSTSAQAIAVNGTATFTGLSISQVQNLAYQLIATAVLSGTTTSQTGNSFFVLSH